MPLARPDFRFSRRRCLKGVALTGMGVIAGPALRTAIAGEQAPQAAWSETTIGAFSGSGVQLRSRGLATVHAKAGARIGAGVILAGAGPQGGGMLSLVTRVVSLEAATDETTGLGRFDVEPGVANGVRRMLGGLTVPRPASVFGFAAGVLERGLEPGQPLALSWEVELRQGDATGQGLKSYLETYHAWVFGVLADDLTFGGPLVYIPIEQVRL